MAEPPTWDETHTTDCDYTTAYRVEVKPDGIHLCEFDPRFDGPVPYMSKFITIPKALVPWFADVVSLAANRAPLFDAPAPSTEGDR